MSDGWELLARWPGGTVAALAAVPDGTGLTLAATAAGLHASGDGGHNWQWIALGPDPVIEAIAVSADSAQDRTVLIGTTSGLHRSTDGGVAWRHVLTGSRVQCLSGTPDFQKDGLVLAGTESDGLLRSENGGRDWTGASAGLLDLNVTALALSPLFGRDRTAFAGTASGLYRSRNGGRAWRMVELGPEAPAVQAIVFSPAFGDDGLVLAGTESDGLFRSDDGGQTWEAVRGFPEPCVTSLAFGDGSSSRLVVAGTAAGLALSPDGGLSWELESPELGPILSVCVVQADNGATSAGAMLAGTASAGIVRRPLDGAGWTPANQGLAGLATVDLALSTAYGTVPLIVVASLDAGVLLSHDAGATWKTGQHGLADLSASSVALVRRAAGEPALLAAFGSGLYESFDIQTGWRRVTTGAAGEPRPSSLAALGDSASSRAPVLAAGTDCLLLSLDGGDRWTSLPPPSARGSLVRAVASPDLSHNRTLFAVTRATRVANDGSLESDGLELWQTTDLGAHWSRWLHAPAATVMSVAVPAAGTLDTSLLVGYDGRVARSLRGAQEVRRGERRPLWQEAQIGNPSSAVTAIALSPRVGLDGIVLAAWDSQVSLSGDGGATFEAWSQSLDVPLVTALSIAELQDGNLDAYVLGLGGTLWRRRIQAGRTR